MGHFKLRGLLIFFFLLCAGTLQADEGTPDPALLQVQNALGLSDSLAHVTDAYLPSPRALPNFILVQDVHNHPEVQSHIASIIVYGYQHWGVKKVFLEGAVSHVDLSVFHRLPSATRTLLLNRLVEEGNLSGPEMAAVIVMEMEWTNPPVCPFELLGLEDGKLYRQNLEAYRQVLAGREQALHELEGIRRLQTSLRINGSSILALQLDRTEALIRLKLTPVQYQEYVKDRAAIPSSPALTPVVRAAEKFYTLVQLRSLFFLQQARSKVPASPGPRILVVGGFHTALMASHLRAEDRSFIVLTPHITQSGYEPLYERRMTESVSALQVVRPFSRISPR